MHPHRLFRRLDRKREFPAAPAVSIMAPLAAARDVELEFEARLDAAPIRAHAPALHDILINLIDNAIRYNASGGSVVVSVFFEDGRYLTRVSDNGPGIAPEHRERVFDRFYRISANDRPPGSGLGLSIVRTLLQQSAGTIALTDGIRRRRPCGHHRFSCRLTAGLPTVACSWRHASKDDRGLRSSIPQRRTPWRGNRLLSTEAPHHSPVACAMSR